MKHYLKIVSIIYIIWQKPCLVLSEDLFANTGASDDLPTPRPVDSNLVVIHLDDNMNRILFDLFAEVFGNTNGANSRIEVPVSTVAELYRNYTQEQLDSLAGELKKLDNRFDIVRRRVDGLQEKFLVANIEYALSKDLSQYERQFIQIGEQLITLQKLVLKFTEADKPLDGNTIQTKSGNRQGRGLLANIFNLLANLLLGVTTGLTAGLTGVPLQNLQNTEPLNANQLNKVVTLMRALQSMKNVSTDPNTRMNVLKLQTMLYRLQAIQQLNRLADERQYLNGNNMNPYRYEAVLNLVKLVGTASGQNQLQTILRMFTSPQTQNRVKNTNTMSQEKLKLLMKAIEEQEVRRRQEMENQRQKDILQELLRNQNRQQEQINGLIKLIESQNNRNSDPSYSNNNNNFNNNMNNNYVITRQPTTQSPTTVTSSQNEIVSKLREQRQQLNNLLKTLGTDFNTNNNNNNGPNIPQMPTNIMGGMGGQAPTKANNNNPQEAFNNILKAMGPMMGMLAQSGLVSPNQMQMTQKSLSELLNQSHYQNRIQYDSYKSNASRFIDLLGNILNTN